MTPIHFAESTDPLNSHDIAVIGLACRFPKSDEPSELWSTLVSKVNAVEEVPRDRWNCEDYYDPRPDTPGKMNTRWGAFLDDVDRFDAGFFRISPREAKSMDPQQRLLLEVAWEALEHAGQSHSRLEGSNTGVFIGICASEYGMISGNAADLSSFDKYFGTGTALSVAAGRIAYVFNFRGPALAIETACSSSLVALHQAVSSLRRRETDLCLAGGVNLILSPAVGVYFSQLGAVSRSPQCKPFDAEADGYVRGEGCGIVALKRLSDAQADGDHVLAVIKGAAINHDGRSAGLTAPHGKAQEAVIRAALKDAGISARDVAYVEAHGTGTRLGDPIEAAALGQVYGAGRDPREPLLIGSIKSNLGHLEAAAGIAGFIKIVLALERGRIPPQIHLRVPNPLIDWAALRLSVITESQPWPRDRTPLAAVSSFGFSGTNAHVIVSAAPALVGAQQSSRATDNEALTSTARPSASAQQGLFGRYLLPLSARSAGALNELARSAHERLAKIEDSDALSAVCRGWALRRAHHSLRLCAVGRDAGEIAEHLALRSTARNLPCVWVFSGQGSQWPGMADEALSHPSFKAALEEIAALVKSIAGWSLLEELRLAREDIEIAAVCVFAVQVALASLWRALGITPAAVVGHSLGEIAAAHVSGALNLHDATHLCVLRSRLLARVAGQGLMALAELPREKAAALVQNSRGRLAIAGYNSFSSTVLSGSPDAIQELVATLQGEHIFCRILRTGGVAGHNPSLAPLAEELRAKLTSLTPLDANIPFISTVEAPALEGRALTADYWARNLLEPVRFADAVAYLAEQGDSLFLEVSPKPLLLASIQQIHSALGKACTALGSLQGPDARAESLANSLAALYEAGQPVSWSAVYPGDGEWEAAPLYPWQRERHWITELPRGEADPARQVAACAASHDDFGITSINMGHLAPWALLTPNGSAVFYLAIAHSSCMVWAYLGPAHDFEMNARWLYQECEARSLHLVVLADDAAAPSLQRLGLEPSPIGALHRIEDLRRFDIRGPSMRRLRAQTLRYARTGGGDTFEIRPGADRAMDSAVAALIGEWLTLKRQSAPAAQALRQRIAEGRALNGHRLFVTRADQTLHCAMLLTPFGNGRGYLLDMEFYGAQTPAGCTETAIVAIITRLASEGCPVLSLGGSYGIDLPSNAYEHQTRYKRKFGPREIPLHLYCAPKGRDAAMAALLQALAGSGDFRAAPQIVRKLRAESHPFIHRRLSLAGRQIVLEGSIAGEHPLVRQHRVAGRALAPGALVIEAMLAGLRMAFPAALHSLRDFTLREPLYLEEGESARIQLLLTPKDDGNVECCFHSAIAEVWTLCATAHASLTDNDDRHIDGAKPPDVPQQSVLTFAEEIDSKSFYSGLRAAEIEPGPAFQLLSRMRRQGAEVEAEISSPPTEGFLFSPALIDAALQALAAASADSLEGPVLLQSIDRIHIRNIPSPRYHVHARAEATPSIYSGEAFLYTPSGELVASFQGVLARRPRSAQPDLVRTLEWAPSPIPQSKVLQGSGWMLIGSESALRRELAARMGCTTLESIEQLGALPLSAWTKITGIALLPNTRAAAIPELARVVAESSRRAGLPIWAITRAVHHPDPFHIALDDAAIWGACRVMQSEHDDWRCGLIDLDAACSTDRAAHAITALVSNDPTERAWWISKDESRTPRLARLEATKQNASASPRLAHLDTANQSASASSRLARLNTANEAEWTPLAGATYLVTGWSGGIGLSLCRRLLDRGARQLLLVARNPAEPLRRSLEEHAQRYGAALRFVAMDIADRPAVDQLFAERARDLPPIRGVFHAAGELRDSLLLRQRERDFESVMATKVRGAWNLHEASRALSLDAFVLFSSAATLFAPPAQGAHAAACAAQDYIARYRHSLGLPGLSIGWGLWAEVGQGAALQIDSRLERFQIRGMRPEIALDALERLMSQNIAHAYVVDTDWNRALPPKRHDAAPAPIDETGMQAQIVQRIARTLMTRIEVIDATRSLEQNGLDSIMTVELRERLTRELGIALPLIDFFREPSIESLSRRASAYLAESHAAQGAFT